MITRLKARVHAEVQAQALQRQCAIEEKKIREMEKIHEQLEQLLDEERHAKKDENLLEHSRQEFKMRNGPEGKL